MSAHDGPEANAPPPELLAAYVDGELAPAECRRVEAWLAGHPDARADVDAQRRLARLLDETAPPPPADEQWADVLARVEHGLGAPPRRPTRRRAAVTAAALVAAAAVLLALALRGPSGRTLPPDGNPPAEEPWPVASAGDIEIVSMDDRDRGALVVGEPPVNEPVELLKESEVQVTRLEPDEQGRVGRLVSTGSPMIIMPLGPGPDDAP